MTLLGAVVGAVFAFGLTSVVDAKTFRTNLRADPAMMEPITYSEIIAGDVLNNKIRVIQRRAYGLRDQEYLRLKVLTCMLPAL